MNQSLRDRPHVFSFIFRSLSTDVIISWGKVVVEPSMVSKCRGLLARNTYLLMFYSIIGNYVWQELIAYLKRSREDFECSGHKEIISV